MKNKAAAVIKNGIRKFMRETQLDTDKSFLLEVNSEGSVTVKGITDINSYDEDNILISSQEFVTELKGKGLYLKSFSETEVTVLGKTESINFIKR